METVWTRMIALLVLYVVIVTVFIQVIMSLDAFPQLSSEIQLLIGVIPLVLTVGLVLGAVAFIRMKN